jgi:hypothetical protein
MKTYKIKNYKGNLVESLSKFQKSHKGMKIVEAAEENDELKIKAEAEENEMLYLDDVIKQLQDIRRKAPKDPKYEVTVTPMSEKGMFWIEVWAFDKSKGIEHQI